MKNKDYQRIKHTYEDGAFDNIVNNSHEEWIKKQCCGIKTDSIPCQDCFEKSHPHQHNWQFVGFHYYHEVHTRKDAYLGFVCHCGASKIVKERGE